MSDYYATLGVPRDASEQDIKRAFRRIARESHPDANPGDGAAADRFREAAQAYEVLSDPQRRAAYDRGDTIDFGTLFSSFAGVEDLLQRFFGGGFGTAGNSGGRPRGADLVASVSVSLAEVATGAERTLEFPAAVGCESCGGSGGAPGSEPLRCERCGGAGRLRVTSQTLFGAATSLAACDRCNGRGSVITDPCATCRGRAWVDGDRTVTVEIPPGIGDRDRLRVSGSGHAGGPGEGPGDLYVDVRVEPDERFERHGADLVHRVSIGIAEAALGTTLQVPLVDQAEPEEVDVAAATQSGTVIRLSRKGLPRLGSRGSGDLLVEVTVTVPGSLTAEQEKALRAFADASAEQPKPPKRRRR
ncbi:MAG TPA: J domain-containing protein [Acidimicrobiia bacterium]|nr:J domain-containing protein [Acidimicrobiia bacterium]